MLVVGLLFACLRILLNKEGRFANCFYMAWIIPVLIVAIFVPLLEERYIMPAYPALIALGHLAIFRVSGRILWKRWAWSFVFAVAAVFCGNALMFRPPASAGERQAAQFVAAERPARILYCCGGRSGLDARRPVSSSPILHTVSKLADSFTEKLRL